MGPTVRIFIGLSIFIMINSVLRLDILLFMKSTQGVVTKAESKEQIGTVSRSSQTYTFSAPDINYSFTVNNVNHIGTSVYLNNQVDGDNQSTRELLKKIPKGTIVKVWYDARNPSNTRLFLHPFSTIFACISLLGGLGFLFSGTFIIWKKWRLKQESIS